MEMAVPGLAFLTPITHGGASSLCFAPFPSPSFPSASTAPPPISFPFFKTSNRRRQLQLQSRQLGSLRPVIASAGENSTSTSAERWLLKPIGDGDCKHIGFRIPLPNPFELASNMVTVGRVPEKADVVIPVATVSGQHARLEKKEGLLLVTDLDSTNGTFIDDKKLKPGVVATVPPGSCITFGDTHLAAFRVSRLENVDPSSEEEKSEVIR